MLPQVFGMILNPVDQGEVRGNLCPDLADADNDAWRYAWKMAETTFSLRTEYITLGQLMKACNMVSSGAEAKAILAEEGITVNGEPENRRGKKLRPSDVIVFADGFTVRVEQKA